MLVSHDMRLISQVAKEIYECKDRTITKFEGTIEEYKEKLQKEIEEASKAFEAKLE